jgi:hypothetical protein
MEIKGLDQEAIRSQARKGYKSAQKSINGEIDTRLLEEFQINGV